MDKEKVYRLDQLTVSVSEKTDIDSIRKKAAKRLRIAPEALCDLKILRRSLDARKRQELHYVFSIAFSFSGRISAAERKKAIRNGNLSEYIVETYPYPKAKRKADKRPVIVGTGPAGLFCGYMLAQAGFDPILIERGAKVEDRSRIVQEFWDGKALDPECNVQFGEGGAGTFSDGKLNSSVLGKAPAGNEVLRVFVKYGADEEILYSNKPHIGTDVLKKLVTAMRCDMERMGAEFRFGTRFEEPVLREGKLCGIKVIRNGSDTEEIETDQLILCIGHSARDTFEMLKNYGIAMQPKPFAVGLRIQHPQELIDEAQYGTSYLGKGLPAADYKLTMTAASGRGVYSFCMCPGGYVVNASSESGRLAVNGMSDRGRDSGVANAAIVAAVDEHIFGSDLFDGMRFQRKLEEAAYTLGGGAIPVECVGDFMKYRAEDTTETKEYLQCDPAHIRIKGAYRYASLHKLLPSELYTDLCEGLTFLGTKIKGFDREDALLAGFEGRTSSPIRMIRDESGQSSIPGIYPCGEGAGYAGGITSAAVDGIKIAEKIISRYDG